MLIGLFYFLFTSTKKETVTLSANNTTINAEVVRTPLKLQKGLSGKANLPYNEGMLFVFPSVGQHGIWMKDMNFPIDIIWLNENSEVVHIEQNVSPDTFPKVFTPDQNAKYVLEVNAGWSREHNIQINTKITTSQ